MPGDNNLELNLIINAETGQIEVVGSKLQELAGKANTTKSSFSGLSGEALGLAKSLGLVVGTGAIIKFLADAVRGAEEQNQSFRRLQFTIEATGQSWERNSKQIDTWARGISNATRFTDSEALATLDRLTRATGNVAQAQKASEIAMGISSKTGMEYGRAVDIVNGLINKNQRAVMESHREFGVFTEKAHTAQEVLTALQNTFEKAAFEEKGLTKESAELHNRWEQMKDVIGGALIPVVSSFLEFILNIKTHFSALAAIVINDGQKIWTLAIGITQAIQALGRGDLSGARAAIESTREQMQQLEVEVVAKVNAIENAHTEAHVRGSSERLHVSQFENEEEARLKAEQLAKVQQFEAESAQKIAQIGQDSVQRQNAMMNAEINSRRQKIQREITDEKAKHALLNKLDMEKYQRSAAINKAEMQLNLTKALDVVDLSVQTLGILNSMGNSHNKAEVNRAKVILALEKSIAIARAIAAAMAAPPGISQAIAGAQIALIAAQFGQQMQAIDRAQSSFGSGSSSAVISTTDLGGFGGGGNNTLLTGPAGGVTPVVVGPGGGASVGAQGVGGGAGSVVINVGGINVSLAIDSLAIDNVEVVMSKIYEAVRRGTVEGVQLAVALQNTANKNSGLAV